MKAVIIDCLGRGEGKRYSTIDVVGIGPRIIAGVLEKYDVYYKLFVGEEVIIDPKILQGYDLLLISAMVGDEGCVKRVLNSWRKYSNGYSIIGGPITLDKKIFRNLDFDLAVVGEGEQVFDYILNLMLNNEFSYKRLTKIKGLLFKYRKKIIFTGIADNLPREIMDKYKPSTRVLTHYPFYWAARVYVEVVRGCSNFMRTTIRLPNGRRCGNCGLCFTGPLEARLNCPDKIPPGCGYCGVPLYFGPARSRSMEAIIDEVRSLIRDGALRIVLSAPDFLDYGRDLLVEPKPLTDPREPPANIEMIDALLSKLFDIKEVSYGYVTIMIENIKPNLVTEEVAKLLGKYFKDTAINLGIESGDEEHIKILGRPNTVEEGIKAVKLLKKYGLRPYVYFIHGLPGQNRKTVIKTLQVMDIVYRAGAEKLTVYRFRPLPLSAYENFPKPPPAVKDKLSSKIYVRARNINMEVKKSMIGKRFRVVTVVRYPPDKRYLVTYPIKHGPVILIPAKKRYRGKILDVIIKGIYKERTLIGKPIKVIHEITNYRWEDEYRINK